jgi:hypothetical protein
VSAHGLDRTLAALADPHRRRVVDLLRGRPYRAGDLAQAARVFFPARSGHLKTLHQSAKPSDHAGRRRSQLFILSLSRILRPNSAGILPAKLGKPVENRI